MLQQDILLSICIPAYNRPAWFERALRSIVSNIAENKQHIEVIISDDSEHIECSAIANKILPPLNISYKYTHNQPKLGMAANWNNSIQLALGKYVLVLHDDDFLLSNGVDKIIKVITYNQEEYPVMLFGVHVVNEQERVIKKQLLKNESYLPPEKALVKVLSNSSFIRFPGIVIRRDIFKQVGYFDKKIGEIADLDMWIRILSKHGLLCLPNAISAYTVHTKSLTTRMFNEETINNLLGLFSKVEKLNILDYKQVEKCKSDFIHQFILAGTYRQIKRGDFKDASNNINLFRLPCLNQLPISIKWLWLRLLLRLALA
ncbi:MAG: glycosyltransferase family 2 protein [Xenococcaceae cyanobacterium MO_188.B29]|nr:glycosyltransferase family 2 protein [Xenococcaceae cyanobacterium MO_188.B29]